MEATQDQPSYMFLNISQETYISIRFRNKTLQQGIIILQSEEKYVGSNQTFINVKYLRMRIQSYE
jgi:hypothetical protein